MGILHSIKKNHIEALKKRKDWSYVYYAIDLHGTIVKPNFVIGDISKEFYPYAKEVLQMLSKRDDVVMYIYTCSHPHEQEQYVQYFKEHGIDFKWINKNPEVATDNNGYGYYEQKPYFNVLFEDKSGFDPMEDWVDIRDFFRYKDSKILSILYKIKRLFKNGI